MNSNNSSSDIHDYYIAEPVFSLKKIILPIFVFLIILMGGGTTVWSKALIICGVGVILCLRPPQKTISKWSDLYIFLLLVLGLVQFLPFNNYFRPDWWVFLRDNLGVSLPKTLSVQPFLSIECYVSMLAGVGWFYICIDENIYHTKRMYWLFTFSILGSFLGMGILLGNYFNVKYFFGQEATVFSYFPNRNQTANILCLCAIISFCLFVDAFHARRQRFAVLSMVNIIITFFALIFILSRSSLILFFVGIILWLMINGNTSLRLNNFKYILPLGFILFFIFIISSGDNLERFTSILNLNTDATHSFRSLVFKDAFSLIKAHLFFGVGLGNFSYVIGQFRNYSELYGSILHPENDWLWVCAELGLLFTSVFLIGVLVIVYKISRSGFKNYMSYRSISTVCIIVFLMHTICDVPGHRMGTLFFVILLLALSANRKSDVIVTWIPSRCFQLMGCILFLMGSITLFGYIFQKPYSTHLASSLYKKNALLSAENKDKSLFFNNIDEGKKWTPLDPWWYFQEAQANLRFSRDIVQAQRNFEIARYLDPINVNLPLYEGLLFLNYNIDLAFMVWQKAIHQDNFSLQSTWLFIFNQCNDKIEYMSYLSNLSKTHPDLRLFYLNRIWLNDFLKEVMFDVKKDPSLSSLNESDRFKLLLRWANSPGAHQLFDYLNANPQVVPNNWLLYAIGYSYLRFYQQAAHLVFEKITPPKWPKLEESNIKKTNEIELKLSLNNKDTISAIALLKIYIDSNNTQKAFKILDIFDKINYKSPIVSYWKGKLYLDQKNYKESWNAFYEYLRYTYKL